MSPWHSIETAPRDKTPILLSGGRPDPHHWYGEGPVPSVMICHFEDHWAEGEQWRITCNWDGAFYSAYLDPTHWMPLPIPPASGIETAEPARPEGA